MQQSDPVQASPPSTDRHPAEDEEAMLVVSSEPANLALAGAAQAAGDTYDAFISYRRAQGWRVARWLSNKLERYRPTKELLKHPPPSLRERLRKPHRVFLDTR